MSSSTTKSSSTTQDAVSATLELVVTEVFNQFTHAGSTISLQTLVPTTIAVTQSVMTSLVANAGVQIQAVVQVLKLLAGQNVSLSTPELMAIEQIIEDLIPSLVAALAQIEQGCIILCDDIVEDTRSCFSRWFSKKPSQSTSSNVTVTKTPTITTSTTTTSIQPPMLKRSDTLGAPGTGALVVSDNKPTSTAMPLVIRQTSTGAQTIAPADGHIITAAEPSVSRLSQLQTLLHNTVNFPLQG